MYFRSNSLPFVPEDDEEFGWRELSEMIGRTIVSVTLVLSIAFGAAYVIRHCTDFCSQFTGKVHDICVGR
jgi:hypothetical protein